MTSQTVKLSTAIISKELKERVVGKVLRDTEVPGLQLRIGKKSASFYLDYKPPGHRPDGRRMASRSARIGSVESHNVAEARKEAARLKVAIAEGLDPTAEKKAKKAAAEAARARATTVAAEADRYISSHVRGSPRHVTTESGALRHAIEEMGIAGSAPEAVTVADVARLLNLHRGRACAVHRYGAVKRFFDMLVANEVMELNPCDRIPRRSRPKPPAPRTRVYSAPEIKALLDAAAELPPERGRFLRSAVLLPLRIGELLALRWSNVDIENGRIVLEGKITKNGDPFMIPLPQPMRDLLALVDARKDTDLVFQLGKGNKPFQGRTKLVQQIRETSGVSDFNFHDLRRTFMTVLADLGVGDPSVADALLNHRQSQTRSGVKAAYLHAGLWRQKVHMMDAWARLVDIAEKHSTWQEKSGTVVALKR